MGKQRYKTKEFDQFDNNGTSAYSSYGDPYQDYLEDSWKEPYADIFNPPVTISYKNSSSHHEFSGDTLIVYATSESNAEIYLNHPDVNLLETYFKNGEGKGKSFRLNITDSKGNTKYYYQEARYSHKHYNWGEAVNVLPQQTSTDLSPEPEKQIKTPAQTAQEIKTGPLEAPRLTHSFETDQFGKKRLFIWQVNGNSVFSGPGAAYLYIDKLVAQNEPGFETFKKIITVGNKDFNAFPDYGYPVFWFRKNPSVNPVDEQKGYTANKPNFLDTVYDTTKQTGFELFGKFYDPAIRAKVREEQKLTSSTTITAPKTAEESTIQKDNQITGGSNTTEGDTEFLERIRKTLQYYGKEYGGDALELALGFIPVVGDVYDLASALLGESPLTGEKFDAIDRALTLVGVLPIPFASGKILRVIKKGVSWAIPESAYRKAVSEADRVLKEYQDMAMKWLKENWAKTEEYLEEWMSKAKKGGGAISSKYADAVDDNFKKQAKERGSKEVPKTDSDYLTKSKALGMAIIITEGAERVETPVDVLMVELRRLVPAYKGVTGFKYEPKPPATTYRIIMLGSEFTVKYKYRTIPWTNLSVAEAAKKLEKGAKEVTVKSKSEAEELYLGLYQSKGLTNTTGMSAKEARELVGKNNTYHWDFHDTQHGGVPHLQIHIEKKIIRIFYAK